MNRRTLMLTAAAGLVVAGCGAGSSPASRAAPPAVVVATTQPDGTQRATIDGTDRLTFTPMVVKAHVGTIALTLRVVGTTPHTLTFARLHVDSGYVAANSSKTITLRITKPGRYRYTCDYHPFMTGELVVSS